MRARAPERRLPVGAEWVSGRGTHFRVWAPRARRVDALFETASGEPAGAARLAREAGGYHSGWAADAGPGTLYRYRLGGDGAYPDPASRFQPRGPHGPSVVVDPGAYKWKTRGWKGAGPRGRVFYELHVGTFTPEGTWAAAARRLESLVEVGVTLVEVMPVADFPGRFGWGYDGVGLFAPTRLYGTPDDFRRFVDRAHALGLGVVLDVVYNHFGPDGAYFTRFSNDYFSREANDWGNGINFDGPGSAAVRELVVSNAAYWVSEYRLDGLRLDATQCILDSSPRHVIAELAAAARAAARPRKIVLVAENETQRATLARAPGRGGYGLDGLWNDDFHHAARSALTGRREAYYSGYAGSPQEFISAVTRGYLFQGQYYPWQDKGRGTPSLDLHASAFVTFLENHDQVSNSVDGKRLHQAVHPGALRALTALLLLAPSTPLLFQGQEFASSAPFPFFADHRGSLAKAVREGRRKSLLQFPSLAEPSAGRAIPDPGDEATFLSAKLDWNERDRPAGRRALALVRDLLRLRREDSVFSAQDSRRVAGAVLGAEVFVLRFFGDGGDDRLLAVNLGPDEALEFQAEPLLAPPEGRAWKPQWASESVEYGGGGVRASMDARGRWTLAGRAASVLRARRE